MRTQDVSYPPTPPHTHLERFYYISDAVWFWLNAVLLCRISKRKSLSSFLQYKILTVQTLSNMVGFGQRSLCKLEDKMPLCWHGCVCAAGFVLILCSENNSSRSLFYLELHMKQSINSHFSTASKANLCIKYLLIPHRPRCFAFFVTWALRESSETDWCRSWLWPTESTNVKSVSQAELSLIDERWFHYYCSY